jgi:predicted  nucleic acid-binding Zn-ribbon protein
LRRKKHRSKTKIKMPHKCARCERIYDSNAKELLAGCSCGSRLFLFLREKEGRSKDDTIKELREKKIKESDIKWLDKEFGDRMAGKGTIRLDIENMIRVDEGKFTLDIASLMSGQPIVVKADEGVYYIDIPYSMKPKKTYSVKPRK